MSSSADPTPFFHPILKRITLAFFIIFLISITLIAYFSPKSPWQKASITKDATDAKPQTTIAPPEGQALAQSTTATPTPITQNNHPPTSKDSIAIEVAPEDASPPPTSAPTPTPQQTEECPGNSKPSIKGVIVNNQKYYYKKGMQHYFLVGRVVSIERWFCNEVEARTSGWQPAPLSILELIK